MDDLLIRASTGDSRIEIATLSSTHLVQAATAAHGLSGTGAIALGRLLSATALVGLTSGRPGTTSIQILSQGRIQQVFADVTEQGWLRGYVKNTALTHPLLLNDDLFGRRTIGPVVTPGQVSVVRMGIGGSYVQSATPLRNGEIDADVDHFLNQSDQVASVLRCDTLVDRSGAVVAAGGVMVRALPDSRLEDMDALKAEIETGVVEALLKGGSGAEGLFGQLAPTGRETEPRMAPIWRCRCSKEKVVATLGMLDVMELAQMVASDERVEVKCELCNTTHVAEPHELEELMKEKTSAES